jgi:hypothetical protein
MVVAGIALLTLLQAAQLSEPVVPGSKVALKPGPQYEAGWFRRFLFGKGWRQLWMTEIEVPVAALDTLRGGLTAYDRGGGGQTLALRFCTPDGRIYQFRSVDKNPGQLAKGFRRTPPIRWLYHNHISAMFPAGALAVGGLEEAAGLPTTERWLAVMPDSPRVGKWREDFKGMLGTFERRHIPSEECFPEVHEAEVIASDTLLARIHADGVNWVDQNSYLTARLLDLLVNDPDRHAEQWSWIRSDRDGLHWWVPIPRDRDWALAHNDGLIYNVARRVFPVWIKFGPEYRSIRGLTMKSESLDRLLLAGMDRRAWDTVAAHLRSRLSDETITAAVATLPAEFDDSTTGYLAKSLMSRRDALPGAADRFYRGLAQVVDIHGSEGSELVEASRAPDGSLVLEMFAANRTPVWRRRFVREETSEIRLYFRGGADSMRIRGHKDGIPLRVITGGGADLVADSTGGSALRVYDDSGSSTVQATGPVQRIMRPPEALPHRDWGHRISMAPWIGIRPELGAIVGAGPVFYSYGFRKVPYQSRVALRLATTTKAGELNADFRADIRFERPDRRVLIKAAALNADVIRFFGFGNETTRAPSSGFHNVIQQAYSLEPVVELGIGGPARFELGGQLRWSETDEQRATLLTVERPYGTGSFTEAGASAAFVIDSRDDEDLPTKGVTLELRGRVFPSILDVRSAFGTIGLVGTSYHTARSMPMQPTLAFRIGAQRALGTPPFFEAPELGGWLNFRGLTTRRFIGDASLYANVDVRLNLGDLLDVGNWGVLGLGDVGRVFQDGESSTRWHYSLGGGVWTTVSSHVFTATLASGGEKLRFYVKSGFHF